MNLKIILLAASVLLFNASLSKAEIVSPKQTPTPSPTSTLKNVFELFKVTDLRSPEITTEVITEPGMCDSFYYVEIRYPGFLNGEAYRIELDFQTLSRNEMDRIASAVLVNYPSRGLPNCMRKDTFSTDIWTTNELSKTLMVPATFRPTTQSCFAFNLPFTRCISVKNLYP